MSKHGTDNRNYGSYEDINKFKSVVREKRSLLREDDSVGDNHQRQQDIQDDQNDFKRELSGYVTRFDGQNSHKFGQDGSVMFMGDTQIHGLDIKWSYSLGDEGCIFYFPSNSSSMPLYNDVIQFFADLKTYYTKWKTKWVAIKNNVTPGV